MTLIAPGLPTDPWYANHDTRRDLRLRMTELGMAHTFDNDLSMKHRWDARWFERAISFLNQQGTDACLK